MSKILMNQSLEDEQEEPLNVAGDKNAKKAMKEEIKTLRDRIMDEVEKGLKKEGIELNLPDQVNLWLENPKDHHISFPNIFSSSSR